MFNVRTSFSFGLMMGGRYCYLIFHCDKAVPLFSTCITIKYVIQKWNTHFIISPLTIFITSSITQDHTQIKVSTTTPATGFLIPIRRYSPNTAHWTRLPALIFRWLSSRRRTCGHNWITGQNKLSRMGTATFYM